MAPPIGTRAAAMLAALVVVACAQAPGEDATEDGPAVRYACIDVVTTAEQLADAPSVVDLENHAGARAFAAAVDDPAQWRAVLVEDDRLGGVRPLAAPETLDGEVRDHERLVVAQVDVPAQPGASGGEVVVDGWMVTSAGPCALRAVHDGLGPAAVSLVLDAPPEPDDTTLSLEVVEQACASGQPATDRVHVQVTEDDEEISLLVGVEPAGGDQTCPSNPATPVEVELDRPVGDRRVVDLGRLPPREIEPARGGPPAS